MSVINENLVPSKRRSFWRTAITMCVCPITPQHSIFEDPSYSSTHVVHRKANECVPSRFDTGWVLAGKGTLLLGVRGSRTNPIGCVVVLLAGWACTNGGSKPTPPPEAYLGVSDKRDSHRQPALHTSRVGFNPLVTHTAIVEVDSLQSSVHCGLQVFTLQLFQATVE